MKHNRIQLRGALLSILFLALLVGCKKSTSPFASSETKIPGTWSFKKVSFQKEWTISKEDRTADYQQNHIIFYDDGSAELVDNTLSDTLRGTWRVDQTYVPTYTDEDNFQYGTQLEQLEVTFVQPSDNSLVEWQWDNFTICNQKVRGTERLSGGTYRYVLERLN